MLSFHVEPYGVNDACHASQTKAKQTVSATAPVLVAAYTGNWLAAIRSARCLTDTMFSKCVRDVYAGYSYSTRLALLKVTRGCSFNVF